jgi:hypothetical protein
MVRGSLYFKAVGTVLSVPPQFPGIDPVLGEILETVLERCR